LYKVDAKINDDGVLPDHLGGNQFWFARGGDEQISLAR
jgi:hypothetical protein